MAYDSTLGGYAPNFITLKAVSTEGKVLEHTMVDGKYSYYDATAHALYKTYSGVTFSDKLTTEPKVGETYYSFFSLDSIDGNLNIEEDLVDIRIPGYDVKFIEAYERDMGFTSRIVYSVTRLPSVWVGGVFMPNGTYLANGATSTTTVKPSGGYAYYKDGTLTLNNYKYEGVGLSITNSLGTEFGTSVFCDAALDIVLAGKNVLKQTDHDLDIYVMEDLFITGDGSLDASEMLESQFGDVWIDSGTITVSATGTGISASNGSLAISGGTVNARLSACFDIEIAGGKVTAVSDYDAIRADRNITIYGGTVTAKTSHKLGDENYHTIRYGDSFTVVPSLSIRASVDPDGTLGPYKAADHNTYDLIVIEAPAFTKQPANGKAPAGKTATVTWKTNFDPIRIEIYYLSLRDQEIQVMTLAGTATSAKLPPRIENYYILAFLNDSVYATSNYFEITEEEVVVTNTVRFLVGSTVVDSQSVTQGACATMPEEPVQEGKIFKGWYTAGGEAYDFSDPVNGNLDLYARFADAYGVTFWFIGDETPIFGMIIESGKYANRPADPAQEGQIFLGWYTADGKLYDFNTPVTKDLALYAKFKPEKDGVIRLAGNTRYDTAFKAADELKAKLGIEKFPAIIVSSGEQFADALAGSYLAAVNNAPILLVKDRNSEINAVKDYIKKNLVAGGTVYLLGGEKAVPKKMETGLDGFTVKRLGGSDRYATNLLILQEAGVAGKDIVVCTGKDFADSLSASAVGLPILLVKDSLSSTQQSFLSGNSGKIYIIGGTNAVSTRIENQLKNYGTVTRLAGATRYKTSVLVAETFFTEPIAAVIAYGENFPDGLSGGPVAYTNGAPLILTRSGRVDDAAAYIKSKGITFGYAQGGTAVLPDKVVRTVFSLDANAVITVK
ncbi:MAG: cell wall-binding repeat-containing protein [Clostridia bacterium]|nr:cell wall-binding repeat-containing protein [Clostridia bacterium]